MVLSKTKLGSLVAIAFLFSAMVVADNTREIPLRGAPAPSMAEAARVINAARVTPFGTATPQTHIVNPGAFVFQTMTPCRLVDTRPTSTAFYQGPIFGNAETRTYDPAQIPTTTCGGSSLPDALAWYANITVTGTTGGPSFLTAYATGTPRPTVATVNWPSAGSQVNNSVIVAAGTSSAFDVYTSQGTHVIIDLVGFFISNLTDTQDQLAIRTDIGGAAAILGQNDSNTNGSHGIGGFVSGTGTVHGVQGQISGAAGAGSSGVHGIGASTGAINYGVFGETSSLTDQSAGVFGRGGTANWPSANFATFGGRFIADGNTFNQGVIGEGTYTGVIGYRVNSSGAIQTSGRVGYTGSDGLYTANNLTAVGTKSFVEPHEMEPTKVVKYVALEGPEAGTYFRGRGRFVAGRALIEVPEDFRMVTDTEGITVQITPIGRATAVGVAYIGLDRIEAEATRDVEFSYLVQGVRKAFKNWQPIQSEASYYFEPEGPDSKLPAYFSEDIKRRLVANGTYNSDGTVNMKTAEAAGWAAKWRERGARAARAGK